MTGIEEVAAGITAGEIAAGAAAASAAVAAAGAISQASAARKSAEYNQQVATQNASNAEMQGQAASEAQQRDMQRRIGAGVAMYGASGVDATAGGSAGDVLSDSVRQGTLDNLSLKYQYKLRAIGDTDQADLDASQASNATTAGYFTATGDVLSGGSNAYYKYSGGGGGTGIPITGG